MTMRRGNDQDRLREPSEAHSSGSSSLVRRTQPRRFWSRCNLLGVKSCFTKEFSGLTEDFSIPRKSVPFFCGWCGTGNPWD